MKAITFALASFFVACGPPLVGVEAGLSPADRDRVQRAAPRPAIEAAPVYETATAETDLPVSVTAFASWFDRIGMSDLPAFSTDTKGVRRIERVEALSGAWQAPGDRRRVIFVDGNTALQEITELRPRVFQLVSWNLTDHAGRYLRYVVEEFAYWEAGNGTHVRWTSSFRPRPYPDDVLIASYIRHEYTQYRRATLAAMRRRAMEDIPTATTAASQ